MTQLVVQNRFFYASNRTTDCSVNTFHFDCDSELPLSSVANIAAERVEDFYSEDLNGSSSSIGAWMTTYRRLVPFTSEIRVYNMADPQPRVPLLVTTYNPPSVANTNPNLPTEVACCLSYVAQRQSGTPVGRSRGRIYLGPFRSQALSGGTGSLPPVVNGDLINSIILAATKLAEYGEDPEDPVVWSLYSTTDQTMRKIVGGWVDDEFDTMRSRGMAYTFRQPWPIVSP